MSLPLLLMLLLVVALFGPSIPVITSSSPSPSGPKWPG